MEQIFSENDRIVSNYPEDEMHGFLDETIYPSYSVVHSNRGFEELGFYNVEGFDYSRALKEGDYNIEQEAKTLPVDDVDHISASSPTPLSVCGHDDRVQINNTLFPFRATCQLRIYWNNGQQSIGTGWFIGFDVLATCGHCIYQQSKGGWAKEVSVYPGRNGVSVPYGYVTSNKFYSVKGWTDHQKHDYDYGFIRLPSDDLGKQVGHYGFGFLPIAFIKGTGLNNVGYPYDKPFGTPWYNAGRATDVQDRKIFYMIDTAGGQSGSAVFTKYASDPFIGVGVHGYGGCPNHARRINQNAFSYFKNIARH